MSDDDLKAASSALAEASQGWMMLDIERSAAKRVLLAEVEAKLDEAFGARVAEAKKRLADTRAALREAEERQGLADNTNMYQGILAEWAFVGYGHARRCAMTGRKGRYEICTRETTFPGNQQFGLPQMGERFVRLLKKDGSPALKFATGYLMNDWLPEGEKPKEAAA